MHHFATIITAGTMAAAAAGLASSASAQVAMDTKANTTKGFVADIEKLTDKNADYRHVLYTGKNLQLVLMSIQPGDEIGEEVHSDGDQFFRIEKGKGEVWINGKRSEVEANDAILVPAGAHHNVKNTGHEPLRLYTLYAPPEHRDGTVHVTKAEAQGSKEHFDGKTSE
jgi:mannose-6-phosphate isomerase-like protein (cupin superfamily)